MNRLYLLSLNNGLSYEDNESHPLVCASDVKTLLQWADQHPITPKLYKDVFHYAKMDYAFPKYEIGKIWSLDNGH